MVEEATSAKRMLEDRLVKKDKRIAELEQLLEQEKVFNDDLKEKLSRMKGKKTFQRESVTMKLKISPFTWYRCSNRNVSQGARKVARGNARICFHAVNVQSKGVQVRQNCHASSRTTHNTVMVGFLRWESRILQ